jgi:hypothetical protein
MADQQSGKISEAEATRIWAATTARGPARVAAFRAADADYQRVRGPCRAAPDGGVTADVAAALTTCRKVDGQTETAIAAARDAVADWVAHMEAIADRKVGRLDPHRAMLQWLDVYRKAPVNIKKFEAAERFYRRQARCESTG